MNIILEKIALMQSQSSHPATLHEADSCALFAGSDVKRTDSEYDSMQQCVQTKQAHVCHVLLRLHMWEDSNMYLGASTLWHAKSWEVMQIPLLC